MNRIELQLFAESLKIDIHNKINAINNWRIYPDQGRIYGSMTLMTGDGQSVYMNVQMAITDISSFYESPVFYFEAKDNVNNISKEERRYDNVSRSDILRSVMAYFTQEEEHNDIIPGTPVEFGRYEGKRISWSIVREDNDGICIIADRCFGLIRFADRHLTSGRWSGSNLRHYLNNDFYHDCFSDEEREAIVLHKTINNRYQSVGSNVSAGRNTMDYIVAPSYKEICSLNFGVKANATPVPTNRPVYGGSYWLRTPGRTMTWQGTVSRYGGDEYSRDTNRNMIRPMLWLRKDSDLVRKLILRENAE